MVRKNKLLPSNIPAWFKEYGTDGSIGVNPAHVTSLKISEISE